jgi:YbbR domain-containing protein
MKPKLILCLALVLRAGLFGLVLASSSCQSLQNREINKTSLEKNGVTAEVSVPDAVSPGQPVEITVRITNTRSQTVYYAYVNGIRELRIHLVDSRNAMPELTPEGKKSIGVPEIYYSYRVEALKPGVHYEWRVDLATLFNFRPGTYQVSVNLKLNTAVPGIPPFEISTDPLGFAIQ